MVSLDSTSYPSCSINDAARPPAQPALHNPTAGLHGIGAAQLDIGGDPRLAHDALRVHLRVALPPRSPARGCRSPAGHPSYTTPQKLRQVVRWSELEYTGRKGAGYGTTAPPV